MGLLDGMVAIVTGAGSGLGREEALLLANYGASVIVNDVGGIYDESGAFQGKANDVVKEIRAISGEAEPNYENVVIFEGAKRIIDQAIETFGKLDILVNNAGILRDRMIFNMTEEEFDAVIDVHLKGTFNCTRHACNYWRAEAKANKPVSGRIINTASDAGLLYNPGQSNYGAAKAGIVAFTNIVAKEMAKYGVTANTVVPLARTKAAMESAPSLVPIMGTPKDMIKKFGYDIFEPKNIAPLVVYLASDDAKDITGRVFRIIGGTIFLLQSWHTVGKAKKKGTWTPKELGPKIKQLISKTPSTEEFSYILKKVGLI